MDGYERLKEVKFFSQFTIDSRGKLFAIIDPTFVKNSGEHFAEKWNRNHDALKATQIIRKNIEALAEELKKTLHETEIELAEAVFTVQVNQVSEDWHLDWYPQEYLIATQTFIAKKRTPNGQLIDENFAGTEYLLSGDIPEVIDLITKDRPRRIDFRVNTQTPTWISGKGYFYPSPTHRLLIHSGAKRVHQLLGIPENASGYSLVSPPHRGSFKELVLRAALAIRFKPKRS